MWKERERERERKHIRKRIVANLKTYRVGKIYSKCGVISILSFLGAKYPDKRPQNNDILIVQRRTAYTYKQITYCTEITTGEISNAEN